MISRRSTLEALPDVFDAAAVEGGRGAAQLHPLCRPVSMPFELPTPVFGAMLAIWHFRSPLQRRFPLQKGKPETFVKYLAWCASEGRRQYAILRAIPEWDRALAQPIALPSQKGDQWRGGYSVGMFLYGVARHQYTFGAMLGSASARNRIARAFWRGDRHARHLPPPAAWQLKYLTDRFETPEAFADTIRLQRKDSGKTFKELVAEFGLDDIRARMRGCASKVDGWSDDEVGPEETPLPIGLKGIHVPLPRKWLRHLLFPLWHLAPRPTEFQLTGITGRIATDRPPITPYAYPFGVNLFGYAKGEIGIGEDVRLVAMALEAQDIPFCIVNVQPGRHVSQLDSSVEHWITDEPKYAINIFCTTGIEQARYACEKGLDALQGRYNIGLWPWELPLWPASCEYAFGLVDEIWGISRYSANAYRKAGRPVVPMTLPVTVDCALPMARSDFGLPKDEYLFVFSFDFNSTLVRKNPGAVVRAFQLAFPKGSREKVGLVVKASHVNPARPAWRALMKLADADKRIHVIDDTLRRPEVLALYRCCDCYVSLHRAEGFGRSLAEALLLDLQLIATDFSGNLDFCDGERVGLVKHKPQIVRKNEYFHGHGQRWADPDIGHAAELMRQIYEKPRALFPRKFDFRPVAVGKRYAQRLEALRGQLGAVSAHTV